MNNSPLPHTRDESVNTENEKKDTQYPLFVALGFLLCTLLVTGYYYWTNYQAQKVLDTIQSEKAEYEAKIQILKSNPEVLAAEVLLTKESEIKKTIEQSNPAIYIRELERIYKSKGITFEGFSYTKGKVTTRLIAQSGADEDAVKKVISLISEYRNAESKVTKNSEVPVSGSGSEEGIVDTKPSNVASLFSLGPVLSVSGDKGERTVNIEFTIH